TCSIWSATSASVERGGGPAAASRSSFRRANSSGELAAANRASTGAHHAATALETNGGTKVTMTTPPFLAIRSRTSSGTLRGWSTSALDEECEKTTGAKETA